MADGKSFTFDTIMRDLKARKFAPIYYLMGDEPYYIDKIVDYIADNVLRPEERDFNQTVMYGSDTTAVKIADAAKRYPMMSDYQVVIVKEAQNLRNTDALDFYLQKPLATTILVMCHKNGTIDRRKHFAATVAKVGVLFESKRMRYDRELLPFIENYLRTRGASIDPKSQQMIADSIGTDLTRMVGELDKLLVAMPDSDKRVTPQMVEDQIGVSKDFNAFELRDAIVRKDVYKANQIVKYFEDNPKAGSVYSMLPMLFSFFQNLMIAYYCPQRNNPDALAKWLDLKSSWATRDYTTGMRNYTGVKVLQIISKIREIDAKSKGLDNPNTPAEELMKELVFFILH